MASAQKLHGHYHSRYQLRVMIAMYLSVDSECTKLGVFFMLGGFLFEHPY